MAEKQETSDRYLAARREWMERYGDYIASAKNWRMIAFGSLAISGLFGAGMVYEADRVHVIPYVVETNHLGETVRLAQAVNAGTYQQPIVRHVLTHWLRLVRERLPDVAAEKQEYHKSYNYIDQKVKPVLDSYFSRHNPYADYVNKKGGRTVTITSALPLGPLRPDGGTFQIQWQETQYGHSGNIRGETHWEGTFSYAVTKPSNNAHMLNGNPFGIYITTFNWNQTLA